MSEPYEETIETDCSTRRRTVKITLSCPVEPRGALITGVPVECSHRGHELMNREHGEFIQRCEDSARCLLKAQRITTRRDK
jgi:hypothetical protein